MRTFRPDFAVPCGDLAGYGLRGAPTSAPAEDVTELQTRHPDQAELIDANNSRWEEMLGGAIDDSVAMVDALRRRAVPLYGLTNWSRENFPIAGYPLDVEAARGLGFHVHHFHTPQGLHTAIAGHGLL